MQWCRQLAIQQCQILILPASGTDCDGLLITAGSLGRDNFITVGCMKKEDKTQRHRGPARSSKGALWCQQGSKGNKSHVKASSDTVAMIMTVFIISYHSPRCSESGQLAWYLPPLSILTTIRWGRLGWEREWLAPGHLVSFMAERGFEPRSPCA